MLTIHRAERADTLIPPLTDLLSTPPDDAFWPDLIAVPSRGVERWVAQQLALTLGATGAMDGVAANILFPSPTAMIGEALSTISGFAVDSDPWRGDRLIWTVLSTIDESISEPWCSALNRHLGLEERPDSHRSGRRYATAASIAGLFSTYGQNRPAMLCEWAQSLDTDGAGRTLAPDMAWQAALFRRLRDRIGVVSPAERLGEACAKLRNEPTLVKLPQRLSVFGPTRLSHTDLAVLEALAVGRELHLWLTHPSPAMWQALAGADSATRRHGDKTAERLANPLLISMSRDIRELQQRLPAATDVHYVAAQSGSSVLARLQDDIRHERHPSSSPRVGPDGSVAIHACHGHVRQVEVLRESLLHLFNDDPTLQARDVIVLCPGVETFAPLMAAAFGPTGAPHPGHRIRVQLADRGVSKTNPLLDVVERVLVLADGRIKASEVLDLAAYAPVAHKFQFSSDDLETIHRWTADAGARWGLGRSQRERFGLNGIRQNTFAAALDRILLGVTADESELVWLGGALPLDDVSSGDVALAGRFAEYLDRLEVVLGRLEGPHSAQTWSAWLEDALNLLTDLPASDIWQRIEAGRKLAGATAYGVDAVLSLTDVRALLAGALAPRPTRSNFRTGDLTVATLVPMRFVPHRVVALIGLDDDAFPRVGNLNGDDILALDPCPGERDPRSEDRQLLLDALMSATEHVVICYTGADPVTGTERPPSAALADVIDTVSATVAEGVAVVTRQPLQPFDQANFIAPQPFSFDRHTFAAAVAGQAPPSPRPPFLPATLEPLAETTVELDDLIDFLMNPTKAFLKQRLGVTIPTSMDDVADTLPMSLSGLEKWEIGERLVTKTLSGLTDMETARQAELRRGTLPPDQLGEAAIVDLTDGATLIVGAANAFTDGHEPTSVDMSLNLGPYRLGGTVNSVYGARIVTASYTKIAARHRIAAWVRLLALTAQTGRIDWEAVIVGRHPAVRSDAQRVVLSIPDDPVELLAQLVELRAVGLRTPLPLAPETSCAYAHERRSGREPDDAYNSAEKEWKSTGGISWRIRNENDDPARVLVYGPDAPLQVVWDTTAPADQHWFDEPHWFGQLARRVWEPLLGHQQIARFR